MVMLAGTSTEGHLTPVIRICALNQVYSACLLQAAYVKASSWLISSNWYQLLLNLDHTFTLYMGFRPDSKLIKSIISPESSVTSDRCGRVSNTPASYLEGPGFISPPGDLLS
jgi:hypothetical protein